MTFSGAALFRGAKKCRHAWMGFRRGAVRRAWRVRKTFQATRSRAKLALRTRRFVEWTTLRVRQLAFYSPPGEQRACPACGSLRALLLEPLSITRPSSSRWKYGFISGCERCGVLFANPLPTAEELNHVYSPAGDWGRHRQEEQEKAVTPGRLEWLFAPVAGELDVLHPPDGATVLDFGCGLGGMLDTLSAVGWTTTGIEPAIDVAFERHRRLVEIPADPTFDLVMLSHVLEHVTEPLDILRALAGATRAGGLLLVRVPNLEGVSEHGDLKYCLRSKTHLMAYSVSSLQWLMAEAGFETVVGSARSEHGGRHLVLLGRRVRRAAARSPSPLTAARAALAAHARRSDGDQARWRLLPVRARAAILNMSRGAKATPAP